MEVSRRRILQKHLEPARPLRRCLHVDIEPGTNAMTCAQALLQEEDHKTDVGIEQFYKILSLHKQKEGRISYSREFLIGMANCPQAKMKPEFLPEHPIVLTEARDLGNLRLHEMRWNGEKDEMTADRLQSP